MAACPAAASALWLEQVQNETDVSLGGSFRVDGVGSRSTCNSMDFSQGHVGFWLGDQKYGPDALADPTRGVVSRCDAMQDSDAVMADVWRRRVPSTDPRCPVNQWGARLGPAAETMACHLLDDPCECDECVGPIHVWDYALGACHEATGCEDVTCPTDGRRWARRPPDHPRACELVLCEPTAPTDHGLDEIPDGP
jgi:hypothetical protein